MDEERALIEMNDKSMTLKLTLRHLREYPHECVKGEEKMKTLKLLTSDSDQTIHPFDAHVNSLHV